MKIDIPGDQTACMTVLTSDGGEQSYPVRILTASGRRMTLACGHELATGQIVKLSWEGYLVLAEVLSGSRRDSVQMHVRHVLRTEDIEEIRHRWT